MDSTGADDHLAWPESDEPASPDPAISHGQPVLAGGPAAGGAAFGVAPRPWDYPDQPEGSDSTTGPHQS